MDTRTAFTATPQAASVGALSRSAVPAKPARSSAPPALPEHLTLKQRQVLTLPAGAFQLQVDAGRLWLTCSDDPDDHFLGAGATFSHAGAGTVVIEGDSADLARLRLCW
ncbi:MAG: DUF2917 domain-containing protein [Leptothrix sp. (in: b-proteobacteria)]